MPMPDGTIWRKRRIGKQTSSINIRDYQQRLVEQTKAALSQGQSPIIQLATGAGKTVIASEIVRRYLRAGLRVWFVCHRREILDQAQRTLTEHGLRVGIVAAGDFYDPTCLVHVCSVGSLPRRAAGLEPPRLIVWDECHHMAAPSWSELHRMFPDAHHVGLTATPLRLDGRGLADWFTKIIPGPPVRDLIDDGYLSRFRVFAPTIPDLRGVHVRKGDYLRPELDKAMDRPKLVGDIIDHYQRIAPGRTALVFAVSVNASKRIVARFNAAGIKALHVDAKTPRRDREAAVQALRERKVQVLSNVELFTEGFDCPAIDALILVRPTRSLALFRQMIGRGLRPADGKEPTIILDHAAGVYEHGLPDAPIEWSLAGLPPGGKKTGPNLRRCPECFAVHAWAPDCPECGYVYGNQDRTIEEVYGELKEISYSPRSEWDEWFGLLESYVTRAGDACVPTHHREAGKRLGMWVSHQRRDYITNTLSGERSRKLESLPGWSWNAQEAAWEQGFSLLERYVGKTGDARVPWNYSEAGKELGRWINTQRRSYAAGALSPQKVARLQALPNWAWGVQADYWQKAFGLLKDFVSEAGHCRVPRRYSRDGISLGNWAFLQRKAKAQGRLDPQRISKLDAVPGWQWDVRETRWEECFNTLAAHASRTGQISTVVDGGSLKSWIGTQRKNYAEHRLDADKARRLAGLPGWSWDVLDDAWNECFALLKSYVELTGHAQVPQGHVCDGKQLGQWVSVQRRAKASNTILPDRADKLSSLPGWLWVARGKNRRPAAQKAGVDTAGHKMVSGRGNVETHA